jgi:predicted metal-dependent phosphoesterase TrpH
MELKEFMLKFLPGYEAKIKEVTCETNVAVQAFWYRYFQDKHFPEALQAFADRICEAQRKESARAWLYRASIEKAKQPKIEEL